MPLNYNINMIEILKPQYSRVHNWLSKKPPGFRDPYPNNRPRTSFFSQQKSAIDSQFSMALFDITAFTSSYIVKTLFHNFPEALIVGYSAISFLYVSEKREKTFAIRLSFANISIQT